MEYKTGHFGMSSLNSLDEWLNECADEGFVLDRIVPIAADNVALSSASRTLNGMQARTEPTVLVVCVKE